MVNVLPPSTDSHTSISQAPRFMLGSVDLHSTLTCCPGVSTCPTLGEVSVAEYVPPALALLTSCGAALSAIAKMTASNPRVFILFFLLFFLRLIKKSCEHQRDRQPIYNYFFVICAATVRCRPTLSFIFYESANTQFRSGASVNGPHLIHSLGVTNSLGAKTPDSLGQGRQRRASSHSRLHRELRYIGLIALQPT